MQTIPLIQMGIGMIGRTLMRQIMKNRPLIGKRAGIKLKYFGLLDSEGIIEEQNGLNEDQLKEIIKIKEEGESVAQLPYGRKWSSDADSKLELSSLFNLNNALLVDATDTDKTLLALLEGKKRGRGLVLSNKIPLTMSYKDYQNLTGGEIGYETTVGAGLPVIDSLNKLMDSGDEIKEIRGALSGTLNFIFTQVGRGKSFSSSVKRAYELGYTEPDPRTDLSGKDLARKALILARTLGYKLGMEEVDIEPLYPKEMDELGVEEFMDQLKILDESTLEKLEGENDNITRYLVSVKDGSAKVGIENLPEESPFTTLSGPENLISFRTARYDEFPLYIRGPGAGPEVTAAGVLNDIIKLSKRLNNRRPGCR